MGVEFTSKQWVLVHMMGVGNDEQILYVGNKTKSFDLCNCWAIAFIL